MIDKLDNRTSNNEKSIEILGKNKLNNDEFIARITVIEKNIDMNAKTLIRLDHTLSDTDYHLEKVLPIQT